MTLFTFNDATGSETALLHVPKPAEWKSGDAETNDRNDLQIIGEHFHPQQIPIKIGMFNKGTHKSQECTDLASTFRYLPFISLYKHDPNVLRTRAFFVHGNFLLENDNFRSWLETTLSTLDTAPQIAVAQSDESSRRLAEVCCDILESNGLAAVRGFNTTDDLAAVSDLLSENERVLVVAGVISGGSNLLSISRSLRDILAEKFYIVGLQVCESEARSKTLMNSLKANKQGSNRVCIYKSVATGSASLDFFHREKEVLESDSLLREFFSDRLRKMKSGHGLEAETSFLPTHSGEHLRLRRDFVFWDPGYSEGAEHAPLVALTVAAVLEKARTVPIKEREPELRSYAMRQVIIDSLAFGRYNDGIIQAAILRNARNEELDYSASKEHGHAVFSLLQSIIKLRAKGQGEAALEFALAISIGKLKLSQSDYGRLLDFTEGEIGDSSKCYDQALKRLIFKKSGRMESDSQGEF